MIDKEFWKDKKIFLTGHTGFKGGWLSLWLHRLGASVTGYALLPPTDPSIFELCGIGELMESVIADVRDGDLLASVMKRVSPEIVIHMAAQPLVRDSYRIPVETYSTNVMGTVNLLEAVRTCKSVKAVVNVTTDKCYENREWLWGYRETEPMGGYDPYSSSKACSELVTSAYRNSFFNHADYNRHGVAIASARAGNVIGGGDWAADRLIPDTIRAILAGEPVQIRNPYAIRPWQHVLEPLRGYLNLAMRLYNDGPEYGEGWNFGPSDDDAKPVKWIVSRMCELWANGACYEIDANDNCHEANYLKLDSSKARMRLGWQPQWDLEKALQSVIEWVTVYSEDGDVRMCSLEQINTYEQNSLS